MEVFNAIIIDDEKPARDLIKNFLGSFDQISVIGEADNGFDGCRMILEKKPDLVFLDVQMPKLTGIELLDLLEEPKPFLIFSTAYDEYAVQAFEKNAVDYLLKPYNRERFNQAIDKFLARPSGKTPWQQNKGMIDFNAGYGKLQRLPVRTGSRILIIKLEDIRLIAAEDDYVKIISNQGNFLKQTTMGYLERSLPGQMFVRIHRSYILNINYLKQLEVYDKYGYVAILTDNSRYPVSRTGGRKLKQIIQME
ncbi:MAG: response regulator [Cyclobacteriaceae bacterium]|nr:response regulator [Cyclobacteriaceae bacterium]